LDDFDFADYIVLLSHNYSQMKDKNTRLETTSARTRLNVHRKKMIKINTTANKPSQSVESLSERWRPLSTWEVWSTRGHRKRRHSKDWQGKEANVMLKNVWASKQISMKTKIRSFNSNVKSVLLYGCEIWRTTKKMLLKTQKCLRSIYNIRWPDKIRNEDL
jgi:hypothetical protein